MESNTLAVLCRDFAENRKATDVVVLDVHEVSTVTDFLVIATGTSEPHLRAILDEITARLRQDHGLRPNAVDGGPDQAWVVLDYFDVIVHIMKPDLRARYDLEGLWADGVQVRPKPLRPRRTQRKGSTAGAPGA